MTEKDTTILKQYTNPLSRSIQEQYAISPDHYRGDIKLGLRNNDGTGVLVGVSKVGSVQGYLMQDGQRVPAPGKLYYRGIELTDIVEAHRKAGTFGFEEVAYLLLMGYLPSKSELAYFDKIMNQARKLPEGFTEGMIMRHPSHNIMNELARSVLSLYSYDPDPDNTSIDNMLLQSVKLVGYFPSIVANAYAVQRHYFHGDSLHIHFPVPELSTAENFLRMMRPDKSYTDEEAHLLDMMLMVHAEHGGGNNSTFVCRAMSSSGTDTYSAIAGAVGSLKGPLHGGANAKVMEMFRYIKENVDPHDDGSIKDYLSKLLDGLKEPVESREIRLNVIAEDFAPAARQLIERLMEYATEHEEWHIAPDNREGVRISFDIDSHLNAAWFLLRLSVHDPVMPLNAESDVPGGVRYVLQKLYEAIQDETDVVDLSPLRAALQ